MARTIRVNIVGNSKSAVHAINAVGTASHNAAATAEATMAVGAARIGTTFKRLDHQLAMFGVPFSGALTHIGEGLHKTERSAKTLTGRLSTLGAGLSLALGAGLAFFGKHAVEAAVEGERVHAQLEKAITNTGGAMEEVEPKIQRSIRAMSEYGYGIDDVETSIAALTRITKNASKAIEVQGLVADIAKARGIDYADATKIMVYVEAGRYTMLRRILGLTKQQVQSIKNEQDAVKLLSAIYGGSAAAAAETFSGKMQALSAKSANFVQQVGYKLLPAVEGFTDGLLASVHGIETANTATQGWVGRVASAAVLLPVTVFAVEKLGKAFNALGAQYAKAGIARRANTAATEADTAATTQAAIANGELTASTSAATIATAEQTLADSAATAAKSVLRIAQANEVVANEQLIVATEAYTVALAAASVEEGVAVEADIALATSRSALIRANDAAAAAAARTAAAQAEVAAAEAGTAAAATSAATATGFLGTGLTGAGAAGLAAVGGLLSFQGTTFLLNKWANTTAPSVSKLNESLQELGSTGEVTGELRSAFGEDLKGLAGSIKELDKSVFEKMGGWNLDILGAGKAGRQAKADIGALDEALAGLVEEKGVGAAQAALVNLTGTLREQGVGIDQVIPRLTDYQSAVEEWEATATPAQRAQEELTKAQEQYRLAVESGDAPAGVLRDRLIAIDEASKNLAREQLAVADSEKAVADATTATAKTLGEFGQVAGQAAEDIAINLGLTDAEVEQLTKSVEDLGKAYNESFSKATSLTDTFDKETKQSFGDIEAEYQKSVESTANWSANLVKLAKAGLSQGLIQELAAAGPESADKVQAIVDAIDDGSVESLNNLYRWAAAVRATTSSELTGAAVTAELETARIAAAIRNLPTGAHIDIPISLSGDGGKFVRDYLAAGGTYNQLYDVGIVVGPPSPRAIGGPVEQQRPYIVGERGPELFIPKTTGTIVPNNKLVAGSPQQMVLPRLSATPPTANVSVPIVVELDGKVIANAVVKHSGRVGGLPIRIRAAS